MSNFGEIILESSLGGLEIINKPATSMPQELATAIGEINEGILGATYDPIWIVGQQIVNGINYYVICKEVRATREKDTRIINMIINVPPISSDGQRKKAKAVKIIEEADLPKDVRLAFDSAMVLVGVSYKPLAYVGHQLVSKSTNHYFICQAMPIVLDPEPYPVFVCINTSFEGQNKVIAIEPIEPGLVGYAFTWLRNS